MTASILIVEDEEQICKALKSILTDASYQVFIATTLKQDEIEASTRKPDLLIVDLGLPDGDGIILLHNVRQYSTVPIIVLSARDSEDSKVVALDAGADDYLVKPFGSNELLARVRAQLCRRAILPDKQDSSAIVLGNVKIDVPSQLITKHDEPVHLTKIELRLLQCLLQERGKILTQRYLLQQVWGPNYVEHPHYLRIYMARLRTKLEDEPANPKFLLTENGIGYRLAT
ncbi:MAG: response regulator [Candidatus Anaerobiospirillum merdipullorum]|uniref:Response regulator n=1 Tax=Candidatus Anaerobiospirillum merdipullorum TaxID=2838450 RepID=A0A9E2KQ44_9GAMM|nr:response regulator [Candidatus Anaerobiospirillum merdipullorum]